MENCIFLSAPFALATIRLIYVLCTVFSDDLLTYDLGEELDDQEFADEDLLLCSDEGKKNKIVC